MAVKRKKVPTRLKKAKPKAKPKTPVSRKKPVKKAKGKTVSVKKKAPVKKIAKKMGKKPAKKAVKKILKVKPKVLKKPVKKAIAQKPSVIMEEIKEKEIMTEIKARKPRAKKSEIGTMTSPGLNLLGVQPYAEMPGEEYMNDPQREHFRRILNQWKQELMQEVDRTVHHMQDEAANYPDPNDRASQETEMSLELRARDRERKLIKKIEEALVKLDQNEYGFCESCGVEIGIRRLEARPTANLCIDCKTLDEIKERQMGAV